jgi:23S rRNA pseudouridine2605 synthase
MPPERIQKVLSQAGLGSRRVCEQFIAAGRVRVNGQPAILGQKADIAKDSITLDGKKVVVDVPNIYIALHKPRNVLSTVKAEPGDNRRTVTDLIDVPGRIYPVGRLDFDSEGLVLLTNDGDLANKLTHPRYGHEKEYKVLLARRPAPEQLRTWQRGIVLEDGYHTARAEVRFESTSGKGAWIRIVMVEGRKRQIREIGHLLGLPVVRIIRVRIGALRLGKLKPRQWRYLTLQEISELKQLVK